MTQMPFVDLETQRQRLGDKLGAAVDRVLEHGLFVLGPEVGLLEERLGTYSGARHVVSCASGTDALVLALRALGVRPGDVVVVPAFTFAASAEAVALVGARPRFVDIDRRTYNLDLADLGRALGDGVPVGVIAVDLFGQPPDHTAIEAAAARAGAWLVVDGAQSFGAERAGRRTGSFGRMTATSFFPAKPLGAYGDGGAVFTDDDELAELLRSLRNHGAGADRYDNVRIGTNSRLDTIQAAILLEKLTIFDDELAARHRVADRYDERLVGLVDLPVVEPGVRTAWAQYTVASDRRDALATALAAEGIPTAVYYPLPLHRQTAFASYADRRLPVADEVAGRVLSLPMHPYLSEADQDRITDAVAANLVQT